MMMSMVPGNSNAQALIDSTGQTADTVVPAKTTLTVAALYGNNVNYYGQTAQNTMPYAALAANVQIPAGFYAGAAVYKLLVDTLPGIAATSLTGGFQREFGSGWMTDLNVSYAFYPANSPYLQAGNPLTLSALLQYTHWFTTGISMDYLPSDPDDYFLTLSNSREFDFYLPGGRSLINFTPGIDLIAGTQQYYETYITGPGPGSGPGKGQGGPGRPTTGTVVEVAASEFTYLTTNFKLPVAYMREHFMFEVAYQLSLLSKNTLSGPGETRNFVTLGLYYQF